MGRSQPRADMFVDPERDPRQEGPTLGDERATLVEYLRYHRLTLELKCADLDEHALARRSVPPSTLSLLGLVRHMAEVERFWFRRVMAAQEAASPRYTSPEDRDGDFDGARPDPDVVAEAWAAWREEIAFAEHLVEQTPDLGTIAEDPRGGQVSLREVLVHMIEEYARHNGHADLLRECIDGRIGQ